MTTQATHQEIATAMAAGTALVVIETAEEARALALVEASAAALGLMAFTWTLTSGLRRAGESGTVVTTETATGCLRMIRDTSQPGVYVLCDVQPFLADPLNERLLREIEMSHGETARTVVLVGVRLSLPPSLERVCTRVRLAPPGPDEIERMIGEEVVRWSSRSGAGVATEPTAIGLLRRHLTGLPMPDARRIVRERIAADGRLTHEDVESALRAKHERLAFDGVLALEEADRTLTEVGGLRNLKRWVALRRGVFLADDAPSGLDPPRGVLLIGVQGAGKSLAARAIAGSWRVPLMRLDLAACYDKYVGETERRLREALASAEVMAPCVLWIDEIEKALASGDADGSGGVSRRMLGGVLTWMAERTSRVFVVATANDIGALPPELVRKGRFDEIFFVDLPDADTRQEILSIHLRRRRLDPARFDLPTLAAASTGFSGAELEQAITAGLYEALAARRQLDTAMIGRQIRATRPLSVVMGEAVAGLRTWAEGRTVPADEPSRPRRPMATSGD